MVFRWNKYVLKYVYPVKIIFKAPFKINARWTNEELLLAVQGKEFFILLFI